MTQPAKTKQKTKRGGAEKKKPKKKQKSDAREFHVTGRRGHELGRVLVKIRTEEKEEKVEEALE